MAMTLKTWLDKTLASLKDSNHGWRRLHATPGIPETSKQFVADESLNALSYLEKPAEHMVKPNETIAQILMPTLRITDYQINLTPLGTISETLVQDKRTFSSKDIIINTDLDAVIPVADCLDNIKSNDYTPCHLYLQGNTPVALNSSDVAQLQSLSPTQGEHFFKEVEKQRRFGQSPQSLVTKKKIRKNRIQMHCAI